MKNYFSLFSQNKLGVNKITIFSFTGYGFFTTMGKKLEMSPTQETTSVPNEPLASEAM